MEVFQNAAYVRLQSQAHGTYVHAAEDGKTVCLDALKTSYNAAWAVERINNSDYFLLRGVYGRYLGAPNGLCSVFPCPRVAATQLDFDKEGKNEIMWRVSTTREGSVIVKLESASGPFLCPSHCFSRCCRAMEWKVEAIPQTSIMPNHVQAPTPCVAKWRRSLKREIHWVIQSSTEAIGKNDWGNFQFVGRDKSALVDQLKEITHGVSLSFFVRAGDSGRLTPLCVNLPHSQEPIKIIAKWTEAGAQYMVFPRVDMEIDLELRELS